MGYMHIQNLSSNQFVLRYPRVYAMEKIHGTSAHVQYKNGELTFFSGGAKHETFVKIFDQAKLLDGFRELSTFTGSTNIVIYGEAYGAVQKGTAETYGKELRFVGFDVSLKMGNEPPFFVEVPTAEKFTKILGLEFVHYVECDSDVPSLDAQRDAESVQAVRNGMGHGHEREGVVIRPLTEQIDFHGSRVIAKHKGAKFSETAHVHKVDPQAQKLLNDAEEIAKEYMVAERLRHVLDHLKAKGIEAKIENTPRIIGACLEDIHREAKGEIVISKGADKSISRRVVYLLKQHLNEAMEVAFSEGRGLVPSDGTGLTAEQEAQVIAEATPESLGVDRPITQHQLDEVEAQQEEE